MIKRCTVLLALLGAMPFSSSYASEDLEIMSKDCSLTPLIEEEFFPTVDIISKSNNLWRMQGQAMPAEGKPILMYGTVIDSKCLPLDGAVVQLWQADSKGEYRTAWDKESLADPFFMSTGTSVTNASGQFAFLTVYPGSQPGSIPHLKLRVRYKNNDPLETKLFFPGETNTQDDDFRNLPSASRPLITLTKDDVAKAGSESYRTTLTLKLTQPFKTY